MEISDYEKIRQSNIERNQAFLNELGLDDVKPDISIPTKRSATSRGSNIKKPADVSQVRRSSRVTIGKLKEELDNLKNDEKSDNTIINVTTIKEKEELLKSMLDRNNDFSTTANAYEYQDVEPRTRLSREPIPFSSVTNKPSDTNDNENWEKALIQLFSDCDCNPTKSSSSSSSSSSTPNTKKAKILPNIQPQNDMINNNEITIPTNQMLDTKNYSQIMSKLKVAEDDVAKLTESRITAVWCHPTTTKLICAAGDKTGNLGIWDVESKTVGIDGVFKYKPHIEGITKIFSWYHDPSKLFTSSYDGTIRYFDLNKEAFLLAFEEPTDYTDGIAFSDVAYRNSIPDVLLIGRSDGNIGLVDIRINSSSNQHKYEWNTTHGVHGGRIQSIQYHPTDPNIIISAGRYNSIYVCM